MLISDSTARALENIAARERDLLRWLPAQSSAAGDVYAAQIPCEAPPDVYFVTRDENGRRLFVRCSELSLSGADLTDGNGHALMGYTTSDGPLAPLRTDAVDASLGLAQNVSVASDGAVTYDRGAIDPATGTRTFAHLTIGRLALARFPAGTRMSGDDSCAAPPAGVEPHIGVPGEAGFPPLHSPGQFAGNRDLDLGLVRLQEAYLALDALRAAGAAQGSVQKTAMDLLK